MTQRQARRTQAQQREAAAVKNILEHEARLGGTYALVAGESQHWSRMPRDGALVRDFMLMGDGLSIRLSHYLKRHGRAYSTLEEAEFVLFGEESSGVLD
ncbi:hypothetical protein [Corallococcus sp. AB038B]|uniref:hypothetical protein n=1 Tax=Corallococcus sp. AB038B TaxID=2316718 RepID=UPI000EBC62DB|nr:hypothetical protein [Corallococcus sp. AB038B]RKI00362.1 hypothetical protein D7Y04_18315 [Corallococcus sp. AB038B]